MTENILDLFKTHSEINREIRRKLGETSLPPMVFKNLDSLLDESETQLKALYNEL